MNDIDEIITRLKLVLHPEGGYYTETYRSGELISSANLPSRYGGDRSYGTAIYYLLTADTFSSMHKIQSDEIFHFYAGDPVEMLQLPPDGTGNIVVLGADVTRGMSPQVVVRRGVWQGARLSPGGRYALMGTTVAPGFDFADFQEGNMEDLLALYPLFGDMIRALSRPKRRLS